MTFREDISRSGGNAVKDNRRSGAIIASGGTGGTLLLIALYLVFGGKVSDLQPILDETQNNPGSHISSGSGNFEHCKTGEDANNNDDCRLYYTSFSVNEVWRKILPEQANIKYAEPTLNIFTSTTQSGCGLASAQTGPFYCPRDRTAYFDLSFFNHMRAFGAKNAPLAQEYILAHEFGHHVQQLEGTLKLSDYNNPGENSNAALIERQADCYAGIWASYADKGENAMLKPITESQLDDALTTIAAVGDDNIQRHSGSGVNPESWTHGSSQQRKEAFLTGYRSGKMASCDLLNRKVYSGSR